MQRVARRKTVAIERRRTAVDAAAVNERALANEALLEHFVDQQEFGPIDVQSFKRGLYFAVLEFADGRIVKRFVKL